jgi:parvulin-like peptidyl-prolyl isomerase
MSEVIKSPYGYHIFKVEEKLSPRQIPFEEAKTEILKDLSKRKGEEEYQKWFKGLREKAKVEINKKLLSS